MKCSIKYIEKIDEVLDFCLNKLPINIKNEIISYIEENNIINVNEIRLHKNSNISLISNLKNIKTNIYLSDENLKEIFEALCDNSLYAHINTLKNGYVSLGKGIRVGICGKVALENEEISGIYDVSSINVRIPSRIHNASRFLFSLLKNNHFNLSVILYSMPGVGKTTILKDLIYNLANETNIRFSVIDSREELTPFMKKQENADFFIGYPKGLGIELATKTMTPQIIICDEITSKNEVEEIMLSSNSGVKLIATTHANDFEELLSKPLLETMFKNKVFDYALGIKRNEGNRKYMFSLNKL